jgi:hypothetical protein
MVDMVSVTLYQINRGMTESGNFAFVDYQSGIFHFNSPGEGKLVVVFVTASLGQGTAVMVDMPFRVIERIEQLIKILDNEIACRQNVRLTFCKFELKLQICINEFEEKS